MSVEVRVASGKLCFYSSSRVREFATFGGKVINSLITITLLVILHVRRGGCCNIKLIPIHLPKKKYSNT